MPHKVLLPSGDGYNRRFDEVLADFRRQKRCTDDAIHCDDKLEDYWWRTIELVKLLCTHCVILNPSKLQFSQRIVDFASLRLSECDLESLPKYLHAIPNVSHPEINN